MKMTTLGILQPGYMPWLGFFEQVYRSDIFVIYDDVQYDKNGWRNRNRIKCSHGIQWLTVPVRLKGLNTPINEVLIAPGNWARKHLATIHNCYKKSPYFEEVFPIMEAILSKEWKYLVDLDLEIINAVNDYLELNRIIIRSSSLGIKSDDPTMRLVKICKHFNADIFYEGASGKNYLEEDEFNKNGIKLRFQNYHCVEYHQLFGMFVEKLSIIDVLFNCGKKSMRVIIEGGKFEEG